MTLMHTFTEALGSRSLLSEAAEADSWLIVLLMRPSGPLDTVRESWEKDRMREKAVDGNLYRMLHWETL